MPIPPVVDAAWLAAAGPSTVLADVRWYLDGRSGRAAYDAGHLPGAIFVDVERDLAGPPSAAEGRHPLLSPESFADALSRLGIGDEDAVVAYDDDGGAVAARLVWMLRATYREAALLDGGVTHWSGALETRPRSRPRTQASVRPWPAEILASADEVASGAHVVLDARAAERYRGENEPVDPRAGHVPGAYSLPCRDNLDESGRFLPVDELRRRFASVGVSEGTSVVAYCGSGVTACHELLALEHAGFPPGRLFAGSWSQWSNDASRAVATGPDPGWP
ncbi:MAG: sulfurtransferase [Acidimicrobiales bacterium]